jgi:hypothetical protein
MEFLENGWNMETPMEFLKIDEKIQFTIGLMKDDFASNNNLDDFFNDSLNLSLVCQMSFSTDLLIKTSYNYNHIFLYNIQIF